MPDWRCITDDVLRTRGCITDDVLRTRELAQIREIRQARSKPLVEALVAWAKAQRALKESRLGEAVTYLNNRWEGLLVFLEEPRVPLSNNSVERNLRGPVVGRKNFAGSQVVRGTEVSAILYALLESAKLAGVESRACLRAAAEAALTGEPPLLAHVYREQLLVARAAIRSATISPPTPRSPKSQAVCSDRDAQRRSRATLRVQEIHSVDDKASDRVSGRRRSDPNRERIISGNDDESPCPQR